MKNNGHATKVNVDQAGYPTPNGLRLQKDNVAKADNPSDRAASDCPRGTA